MPPKKKAAAKTPEEEAFQTLLTMLKNRKAGSPPLVKPIDQMVMEYIDAHPGIDINETKNVGGSEETILKAALANKETTTDLINYLIDKGADVTIPEAKDGSPLEVALRNIFTNQKIFNKPKSEENKFEILLMNGATGEQLNSDSALFSNGSKKNLLSVITRLCTYDMEFPTRRIPLANIPDKTTTPLHRIVASGAPMEVMKFLIEKGADPNALNEEGGDLLSTILDSYHNLDIKVLEELEKIGFDLKRTVARNGNTLLHNTISHLPYRPSKKDITNIVTLVQKAVDIGVDVNAKNKEGNTAIYLSLLHADGQQALFMFDILKILLSKGAKIDEIEPGYKYGSIDNATSFHLLCKARLINTDEDNGLDVLMYVLDFVANNINHAAKETAYRHTPREDSTPLWLLIKNTGYNPKPATQAKYTALIKKFKEKGCDINQVSTQNYTVLGYADSLGQVQALMDAGADVNVRTFPIFNWAHYGIDSAREDMSKALMANPTYNFRRLYLGFDLLYYLRNPVSKGKVEQEFYDMIKQVYNDNTGYKNTGKLWEGWTSTDADKLETVFDEEAGAEVTLCPVCLKTVSREDGCMYIRGHNCANLEGYYHKELYDKYKSAEGIICWCTICNRIASGHRHYELGFSKSSRPNLLVGHDPFNKDCSKTEGGGGLKEKFLRFRRLREHARDMMEDIGKVTENQALDQLVEEMWNAPLQRKRGTNKMYEEKKFNFPASNFPAPARPTNANAAANKPVNYNSLPNVPNQNAARPPTTLQGKNNVMQLDEDVVIQFHHVQPDGSIYNHDGNYISPASLEMFLDGQVTKHKSDEFGFCWAYPGKCKGRLHPEEIKPFVPEELYKDYKGKFNWKFGPRQGGNRTGSSKRTTRRLSGGAPRSIFVPATDAQCYLPSTRKNNYINRINRNNTRKNNRF